MSTLLPHLTATSHSFFLHYSAHHRDLHSFPTRRSSDLESPGGGNSQNHTRKRHPDACQNSSSFCVESQPNIRHARSEEHTSELQSHHDLVCRLLLEKKKKKKNIKHKKQTQHKQKA